jgi:hypothetical protein
MKQGIDLHLHTTISDGLHSPTEIVRMAQREGLRAIAISDHDAVDGIAEAIAAAQGSALEVIPGLEISTDADDLEVHVLGYYIDYTSTELATELAEFREARVARAKKMLEKLAALGVQLSWARVREIAGDGAVGRPHIALALQEAHYVGSSQEAFDRYLGRGRPAYVSRLKKTPLEAIQLIRKAGGLAVLAHPWGLDALVGGLARQGLVGLEAYYNGYSTEAVGHLCWLARQHHLLCTGGSDFHGLALLPENRLGQVHVPESCLHALHERQRLLATG